VSKRLSFWRQDSAPFAARCWLEYCIIESDLYDLCSLVI